MKIQRICLGVLVLLTSQTVSAQQYTRQGAVLGGAAGALTGAAIGKQNKETAAGALIGGAVGLITGATIGKSMDQDQARNRAIYYEQQQRTQQRINQAVSIQDVITMVQNGVADSVIVAHIRQNGVRQKLQVHDVIAMHKQGVSENVIGAMQNARLATAPPPVTPVYRRPVVIQEHHYVAPRRYYPPPVRYHHHHYHRVNRAPRSSVHWHFRF